MRSLLTAIRTLTIIPLPGRDCERLSSCLLWFPWVGLILGGILYGFGILWCGLLGKAWFSGGGALLLAAGVILTRGLHLDGLADWVDAVGADKSPSKRLSIMKDPHLGTFGVLALILVLILKWTALTRLLSSGSLIWIVPIFVIPRDLMVELMTTMPYARPGGGTARPFLEGVSQQQRIWSHCMTLGVCLFFGPAGIALLVLGWIVTVFLRTCFKKSFGGITGDLLGATNELVETALLMACALPGEKLLALTGWVLV